MERGLFSVFIDENTEIRWRKLKPKFADSWSGARKLKHTAGQVDSPGEEENSSMSMAPGFPESVEVSQRYWRRRYHQGTVLGAEREQPASPKHLSRKRCKTGKELTTWKGENEASVVKTAEHLYLLVFVCLNKAKHKYIDLAETEGETKGLGSTEQWEIAPL